MSHTPAQLVAQLDLRRHKRVIIATFLSFYGFVGKQTSVMAAMTRAQLARAPPEHGTKIDKKGVADRQSEGFLKAIWQRQQDLAHVPGQKGIHHFVKRT